MVGWVWMIYASQSSVFKPLGGHKEASLLLKQTSHMRSSRPGYRHWIPIRRTLTIFPVILCLSCSRCHDGNSDGRIRTARCRSPLSFPPSDGSSFHSAGGFQDFSLRKAQYWISFPDVGLCWKPNRSDLPTTEASECEIC